MARSFALVALLCSLALFEVAGARSVILFRSVRSARPQFFNPYVNLPSLNPLQASVGVQTPIAGADLSASNGLTITGGRQQVRPGVQPYGAASPVQQSQPNGGAYAAPPAASRQPVQSYNAASEDLGTRINEEASGNVRPAGGESPSDAPEEFPCQNYDPSAAPAGEEGSDATENPCAGIGGGNKINPKQAALLSLVG